MSFHTLILVGNLGKEPEMRYTPSGQAVCNLNVAVNDNFTNSAGEKIERTLWFHVATWGKLAETCNTYLKKGRKVLVEGRLIVDQATGSPKVFTKNDGTFGSSFEVNANTVRFLSPKGEGDGEIEQASEEVTGF